jgi:hypothetical protein
MMSIGYYRGSTADLSGICTGPCQQTLHSAANGEEMQDKLFGTGESIATHIPGSPFAATNIKILAVIHVL